VELPEGVPGSEQVEGGVVAPVGVKVPEGELLQLSENLSSSHQVVVP